MASSTDSLTKVLLNACLNVAFLLLLFFYLSHRGCGGGGAVSLLSKNRRFGVLEEYSRGGCAGVRPLGSSKQKCAYLAGGSGHQCYPRGYIDYLYLFYCVCGDERRVLGYVMLLTWLAVLFYLLGDTAAVYFCSSLEGLSRLLGLPPAIAGVTLLSLGNGAPDALSTLVSFAGRGGGATAVGLNGVLGGALFVSSAVLGVISLHIGGREVAVDRASFFRDASFLICALVAVAVVLAVGKVTIWGSLAFASLYLVYVLAVAIMATATHGGKCKEHDYETDTNAVRTELRNVAEVKFYGDQEAQEPLLPELLPLLPDYDGGGGATKRALRQAAHVLMLPLSLPRRLTIPDASKERWNKPAAVTAATVAPLFLALLWSPISPQAFLLAGLAGLVLGLVAFTTTTDESPPGRFLVIWLAGGFLMSVTWAYVVAQELLSLLVSLALVLAVDSAMLGLTLLAWGNSLGDLIANLAVAVHGGPGGAQVALSGCYGGPLFNVLVGLGLSLVLASWAGHPEPVAVPADAGLYQTLGFAVGGIVWAVVVLPKRRMRVDRTLGFGLLAIYLCFLCLSLLQATGLVGWP